MVSRAHDPIPGLTCALIPSQVPEYKPDVTLAFLTAFVRSEPFQTYVPPKKRGGGRAAVPDVRAFG